MGYKSITQIVLFITAVVLVLTYIQPTFIAIKETQDEIFQYSDASDKATELNAQLARLLGVEQSFRQSDMIALDEYLPTSLDDMEIMADVATMADASGIQVISLTSEEVALPAEDILFEGERIVSDGTSHLDVVLEVSGTYQGFKNMLRLIEQNKYPLEIVDLAFGDFSSDDDATIVTSIDELEGLYTMTLRVYAYSGIGN